MGSYEKLKREFYHEIFDFIETNKKKKVPLNALILKVNLKYGFGEKSILAALKPYVESGAVKINESMLEIH